MLQSNRKPNTSKRIILSILMVGVLMLPTVTEAENNEFTRYQNASASLSPADNTTYYFSLWNNLAVQTVEGNQKSYFTNNGTIKSAWVIYTTSSATSTTESINLYLRVNGTTDYLLFNDYKMNVTPFTFSTSTLNIPVVKGDYYEIKMVTPGWSGNPVATRTNVEFAVETEIVSSGATTTATTTVIIGQGSFNGFYFFFGFIILVTTFGLYTALVRKRT